MICFWGGSECEANGTDTFGCSRNLCIVLSRRLPAYHSLRLRIPASGLRGWRDIACSASGGGGELVPRYWYGSGHGWVPGRRGMSVCGCTYGRRNGDSEIREFSSDMIACASGGTPTPSASVCPIKIYQSWNQPNNTPPYPKSRLRFRLARHPAPRSPTNQRRFFPPLVPAPRERTRRSA